MSKDPKAKRMVTDYNNDRQRQVMERKALRAKAREVESKAHRRKATMKNTIEAAENTAKTLTNLYGKPVVVDYFNGFPIVVFKHQVTDGLYNKPVTHYP